MLRGALRVVAVAGARGFAAQVPCEIAAGPISAAVGANSEFLLPSWSHFVLRLGLDLGSADAVREKFHASEQLGGDCHLSVIIGSKCRFFWHR